MASGSDIPPSEHKATESGPNILNPGVPKLPLLKLRIVVILLLPVVSVVFGLLYLDQYRRTVLEAGLTALERQGAVLASTIGLADAEYSLLARRQISQLTIQRAADLIATVPDARIRVFQPDGRLITDSAASSGLTVPSYFQQRQSMVAVPAWQRWPVSVMRRLAEWLAPTGEYPLYRERAGQHARQFPEVVRALSGETGRRVWRDENGMLMLSVAVPVRNLRVVRAALLVTASGAQAERDIATVQFSIFQVFGVVLVITLGLGLYLSGSIVKPLTRLARAADQVRLAGNKTTGLDLPELTARRDEIGALARTLSAMTSDLQMRMKATADFAADVAHEIKNPLSSLRSAVETMARIKDPASQRQLMEIILMDVGRLDRLITDISSASRLDADLSAASFGAVDLKLLLASLVSSYQAREDGPEIRLELPDEPLIIAAVPDRLSQVIDNLLANARSFSPADGIITLCLSAEEGMAIITIEDQGPGIPEGKAEKIFERFYTERPSGEEFGRHSGLGLSIARQIAEAHGGSLTADNRQNRRKPPQSGAVFTLILPMA